MKQHDSDLLVAILAAAAFFGALVVLPGKVRPQDHSHGHEMHHDHYRTWMRPATPWIPCCNAKEITPDGRVSGDCYPTIAEVRDGSWWARRDTGEWIKIEDEKLVRYPNPDPTGRDAHLCEISGVVFCFRPPVGGT